MGNLLMLSGGAPNLTFMAGGLLALDDAKIEFEAISTSGAGMLVGLLYLAPNGMDRKQALRNTVNLAVNDKIYNFLDFFGLSANYKVFHKSGWPAVGYTRIMEEARKVFLKMVPGYKPTESELGRFFNDLAAFQFSLMCPTTLSLMSKATCQPAPFIHELVDFAKLNGEKGKGPEFFMGAYSMKQQNIRVFARSRNEITAENFQAALAFPFVYSPFDLEGDTFIEGAAFDTFNFEKILGEELYEPIEGASDDGRSLTYKQKEDPDGRVGPIDNIILFNILGHQKLIRKPRNLLDALSMMIIVPLVAAAKDDITLFKLKYMHQYGFVAEDKTQGTSQKEENSNSKDYGQQPKKYFHQVELNLDDNRYPEALNWSYSNMTYLFDQGYESTKKYIADHPQLTYRPKPVKGKAATAEKEKKTG